MGPILVQKGHEKGQRGKEDRSTKSEGGLENDLPSDSDDPTKAEQNNSPAPFREFTPSEKIDADQAVDFPADI
jgi:hypothetical protein